MTRAQLTDDEWVFIEPYLPVGEYGPYPARLRQWFEGVIWRFRRGAQWREVSAEFGAWSTMHNRFRQWRDAGVAPAPRDSGKVSGNLHRPITYHRRLQRVFHTSALVSVRCDPNSRKFYDRKRAEGKKHVQAVLALARRRVNVLWALIRERRCCQVAPPATTTA